MMASSAKPSPASVSAVVPKRVAVLTNILLRHAVVVLEALQPRVQSLRVFLSAVTEPDRKNPVHWGDLDVVVQKALRWTRGFRNKHGYQDVTHLQIPYDTLPVLWAWKPDVLISGQLGGRTLQAAMYKILRPKTLFIVWATLSQRTEATRGGVRIALRKWILRKADACLTHGADSEGYLRSLGFKGPVFHTPYVIESGQYTAAFCPPTDGMRKIVYTGQLIERKGIVPFTEALSEWCRAHPETPVQLLIGGDGPERARLEALRLPASLQMTLAGHLDHQAIADAYRNASFCVFPTLGDEWGMVVNEAFSAGVPILASVHAQASLELVRDGVNGWMFDPEDRGDTLQGLEKAFAADADTLLRMSREAKSAVAGWTPEVMAGRMADAIEQMITRK